MIDSYVVLYLTHIYAVIFFNHFIFLWTIKDCKIYTSDFGLLYHSVVYPTDDWACIAPYCTIYTSDYCLLYSSVVYPTDDCDLYRPILYNIYKWLLPVIQFCGLFNRRLGHISLRTVQYIQVTIACYTVLWFIQQTIAACIAPYCTIYTSDYCLFCYLSNRRLRLVSPRTVRRGKIYSWWPVTGWWSVPVSLQGHSTHVESPKDTSHMFLLMRYIFLQL